MFIYFYERFERIDVSVKHLMPVAPREREKGRGGLRGGAIRVRRAIS